MKLEGRKRVGKAYATKEKADLIQAAKTAPRSEAVYLGTMLALNAGIRHKEIRTMQREPKISLMRLARQTPQADFTAALEKLVNREVAFVCPRHSRESVA